VARVRQDRGDEAAVRRRRPSVVQEEDALADAPERRGPELVAARATLLDVVREPGAHVMEREIAVELYSRGPNVGDCQRSLIATVTATVLFGQKTDLY